MGRPSLPVEQRQLELIGTRLTRQEKRRFKALLDQRGVRESVFLRALVLEHLEDVEDPGESAEVGEECAA